MSATCRDPLGWEALVRYWSDDLGQGEQEALEEHLIDCETCSAESARVAQISEAIRSLIPPVLRRDQLEALRAKGLRVQENPMHPGERREVEFPEDADLLIHVLGGIELQGVEQVSFVLRAEQGGQVLVALDAVPFDRSSGAILLACQKHYAFLPHDTVAELTLRRHAGLAQRCQYTILHRYPRGSDAQR